MDFSEQIMTIQGNIPEKKNEISLKTLSKKKVNKIRDSYIRGRDAAKKYYSDTIQPAIIKRQDVYNATKKSYAQKFPALSELTDWVSRDVKTSIDWMVPSLVEVFTGTDDPCDIKGTNINDDKAAEKIQQIVKYQINKKNGFFIFLKHFLEEGLITNEGIAKVYWDRKEDRTEMEVLLDEENTPALLDKLMKGEAEIKELEIFDDIAAVVKYDDIKVHYNAPVLENMSPSELRFTPDGKTLQECKFVAQRKIVKGDYLKQMEQQGIFTNVDKALKEVGDSTYTELDEMNNQGLVNLNKLLENDGDNASKDVELYEAYLDVDYDNDGLYEKVIVHAVGDVILSIQDNAFKTVPFFMFAPELDPYTPFGKSSVIDTLEQLQDAKTAMIRQLFIAIAKNNRPQRLVNVENVDVDQLINGDEIVLTNGSPKEDIYVPPQIPVAPITMDMINYMQNELESQSGSTKYNQGLDSNSLNKTATGITAVLGQADKKIRHIARVFAETAWVPIIKHIIKLNQTFLTPYQQFRLNDEMVEISPEELDLDYDLTVNTGQGAGTKEAQLNYLITVMQQLFPTLQQIGLVDETGWYEISKDLLEKMGIRNVQNYINDPSSQKFQQKQAQQQQEIQAKEQQALALRQQEIQAKTAPKLSANYKDLPIDAKQQALQKYGGLNSTPQNLMNKENLDADKWRY